MRLISAAVKTRHPFLSRATSAILRCLNHRSNVAFETPSFLAAIAVFSFAACTTGETPMTIVKYSHIAIGLQLLKVVN